MVLIDWTATYCSIYKLHPCNSPGLSSTYYFFEGGLLPRRPPDLLPVLLGAFSKKLNMIDLLKFPIYIIAWLRFGSRQYQKQYCLLVNGTLR